jgi:methylated-DNA-[protein]-cysteine S-methyltransferase
MHFYRYYPSPLGEILLVSTISALRGLHFVGEKYYPGIDASWIEDPSTEPLQAAAIQLDAYFAGRRREFDIPLDPEGTAFQREVWSALRRVRYADTLTYGELAQRIGKPKAVRAVGAANGRNPISIIVPCHRIIGADGSLTGYAGGLARKRALLALEIESGAGFALRMS